LTVYTNSFAESYMWSGPNGFSSNLQNPSVISPVTLSDAGTYRLKVFTECGSAEATINVVVNSNPQKPTLQPVSAICYGEDIVLRTNSACGVYNWVGPKGAELTATNSLLRTTVSGTIIPVGNEAYDGGWWQVICENNLTGCKSQLSDPVFVNIKPEILIPPAESNSPICAGEQLDLKAHFIAGATYQWTGPNGFISNLQNPSIPNCEAINDGMYQLHVTYDGCTTLAAPDNDVQILPRPTVIVGDLNIECSHGIVDYTIPITSQTGTAPYLYHWVGPNGFYSVDREPVLPNAISADEGSYTVLVTDGNNCISEPVTTVVGISDAPQTPIIKPIDKICEGEEMELVVQEYTGAVVDYEWITPVGGVFTTIPSLIQATSSLGTSDGRYKVRVTVDGCTSLFSAETNVDIVENPINPNASSAYSLAPMCEGGVLTLSALGDAAYKYLWTGPNGFTSQQQNPVINLASPDNNGHYTVIVTNDICQNTSSIELTGILPIPETPNLLADEKLCSGEVLELSTFEYSGGTTVYNWTTPLGVFSTTESSYIISASTMSNTGNYAVTVTVDGCTSLASPIKYVNVDESPAEPNPVLTYSLAPSYCAGGDLSINIAGNAIHNYLWSGPNGFVATSQNIVIQNADISDNGSYLVKVKNGLCEKTSAVSINLIKPYPDAPSINLHENVCSGDVINLTTTPYSGGTVVYNWNTPTGMFNSNIPSYTVTSSTLTDAGNYSLTVTVDGCESKSSQIEYINVSQTPINPTPAFAYADASFCAGDNLTITALGDALHTYQWTLPNGSTMYGQQIIIPNASEMNNGSYLVKVKNNSCESTNSVLVTGIKPYPNTPTISESESLCVGERLNLISNSYSGASVVYYWNTPLGEFSTAIGSYSINSVTTTNTGNYSVEVEVNGCRSLASPFTFVDINSIPVNPGPTDAYSFASNCSGGILTLTATGDASHKYKWTGPNGFEEEGQTVVISNATEQNNGSYTVSVNNKNCTNFGALLINYINPYPVTPTISNVSPLCENQTLMLNTTPYSGSSIVYSWSIPAGGGSIVTTTVPSLILNNVAVADAGNYSVSVSVNGCQSLSSSLSPVVINAVPVTPAPIASYSLASYCSGGSLTLSASGSASHNYLWTGPNNFSASGQTVVSNNVNANNNGSYKVTVTNGVCSSTDVVTINSIKPYPSTPELTDVNPLCANDVLILNSTPYSGSVVNYNWITPTGAVQTNVPSLIINPVATTDGGNYSVSVEVDGCSSLSSSIKPVIVKAIPINPAALASYDLATYCSGGNLTLSASGNPSHLYDWTGPNGFTASGSTVVISAADISNNGTYAVNVFNGSCRNTSTVTINSIKPYPQTPIINEVKQLCEGEALTLVTTAYSGTSVVYNWLTPTGLQQTTVPSLSNPSVLVANNGTYAVSVNVDGCVSLSSSNINVVINQAPVAPVLSANSTVLCEDDLLILSTNAVADIYKWSGPNGFTSALQYPTVINPAKPINSGNYNLEVSKNGCKSQPSTIAIVVNQKPYVPILDINNPICYGDDLEFTSVSAGNQFIWTNPVGVQTVSNPPFIVPSSSSIYKSGIWKVNVSDLNGCISNDAPVNVQIREVPIAIASNSSPVCSGSTFQLFANSVPSATYKWYADNAGNVGSLISTNQNLTEKMANGTYTYYLAIELNGCISDTVSTLAVVSEKLAAPQVPANFEVCEQNMITLATATVADSYKWTGPNGFYSDAQNPLVIQSSLGIHAGTYYLSVTIDGCGSSTNSVLIGVNDKPETPFIFSNAPVCEGETVTLNTQSGQDQYTWYLPNGNTTISSSESIVINSATTSDTGNYKVKTTANGCYSDWSQTYKLIVDYVPTDLAYAGEDVFACSTNGIQISANSTDYSGRWTTTSPSVQIVTPNNENSYLKNIKADSVYVFKWTLSNGACENFSVDYVQVTLARAPVANVDYILTSSDNSIENVNLLENDSLWMQTVNFYIAEEPQNGRIKINPDQTIDYAPHSGYVGDDEFIYEICLDQCPSLCDTAMVYTNTEAYIEVPDIITPNGDGDNEYLIIIGLENYPENIIYIYNRWGKEVYRKENYQNDWNGTYKGNDLPVGTYFYVFIDKTNGKAAKKGYITLHR